MSAADGKPAGDAEVRVTRLDNGLTVATDTMSGVDSASIGVWVDVGTRHEPQEINGVAHLLEHMAFKGTARRSARDISVEIESVGGHLNAYTSRENTAYYARVLADDLPIGFDIIADILQHSVFDQEELERERTVILQEIGQAEDTPDDIIFDRFQATAYPDQAIGRPVLGRAEVVSRVARETIRDYMRRHYSADRLVLTAAGRVDHDRLVELAAAAYRDLPRSNHAPAEPSRYVGGDHREARELEQVHLLLGLPGVGFADPDYYVMSVLSTLLGGGMSSRLFQEVREKRGLVYSIHSFASSYSDGGVLGVYAGTGESEVAEMLPIVCDEIVKIGDAVEAEEVRRARAQLRASVLMARESTSARGEQLAQQLLIYGRPLSTAELIAEIEAVDETRVATLARRLIAGPLTVAALGPIGRIEEYDRLAARLR
jgi:predicted Zn-dependent peptidase